MVGTTCWIRVQIYQKSLKNDLEVKKSFKHGENLENLKKKTLKTKKAKKSRLFLPKKARLFLAFFGRLFLAGFFWTNPGWYRW